MLNEEINAENYYQNVDKELSIYEFNMKSQRINTRTTLEDIKLLQNHIGQLENEIKQQRIRLDQLMKTLQEEHEKKKNRMEYDALAASILQHPDRKSQQEQVAILQKELKELQQQYQELVDKTELQKKNFRLLMQQLHENEDAMDESK